MTTHRAYTLSLRVYIQFYNFIRHSIGFNSRPILRVETALERESVAEARVYKAILWTAWDAMPRRRASRLPRRAHALPWKSLPVRPSPYQRFNHSARILN